MQKPTVLTFPHNVVEISKNTLVSLKCEWQYDKQVCPATLNCWNALQKV